MHLDVAYFNYERGGRSLAGYEGDVLTPAQFRGLARVAGDGGRWPHILIMGEAEHYDRSGGAAAWNAAAELRYAAGDDGPPYVPLLGCTIFDGPAFAPLILFDPRVVVVRRWYDCKLPDHAGRNDNVLMLHTTEDHRDGSGWIRFITGHGDIHGGDRRLLEAQTHDRHANPIVPTIMAMDFNETPSGSAWEATDYDDPEKYQPWQLTHRARWYHGPRQAGPHEPDTRALDYLCGYWVPADRCDPTGPGRRVGGCGWYDVAELAGDTTPTKAAHPSGRQALTTSRFLVNAGLLDAVVPGSYQVHQPADPERPDSDHLRISVTLDV